MNQWLRFLIRVFTWFYHENGVYNCTYTVQQLQFVLENTTLRSFYYQQHGFTVPTSDAISLYAFVNKQLFQFSLEEITNINFGLRRIIKSRIIFFISIFVWLSAICYICFIIIKLILNEIFNSRKSMTIFLHGKLVISNVYFLDCGSATLAFPLLPLEMLTSSLRSSASLELVEPGNWAFVMGMTRSLLPVIHKNEISY